MHLLNMHYIILLLALVCAVIAALDVTTATVRLIAASIAFLILSMLVTGCAGGLHGKGYVNATGSVTDPTNVQYNTGAEILFAKRHQNKSGK